MKDALETTKTLHQFLCAASATVFAFAIAADKRSANDYADAINDLKYVLKAPSEPVYRAAEKATLAELVAGKAIHKSWLADDFEYHAAVRPSVTAATTVRAAFDELRRPIGVLTCTSDELAMPRPQSRPLVRKIEVSQPSMDDVTIKGKLKISFQHGGFQEQGCDIGLARCNMTGWTPRTDPFLVQPIRCSPSLAFLEHNKGPVALSLFVEVVDYLPVDKAISVIAEMREKSQRQLTLFGITANQDIVVFFGPLLLLVIGTVFRAHAIHLDSISSDKLPESKNFPWLLFFSDRVSWVLSWVSVVALPSGAIVVLVIELPDVPKWLRVSAVVVALGTLAVNFLAMRLIESARKRLGRI